MKNILCLCGLLILFSSLPVQAEETRTQFKYEAGDATKVQPLDPQDPNPDAPIVPENWMPGHGGAGALTIDFASPLDFGKQKIQSTDQTYFVSSQAYQTFKGVDKNGPLFVQVSDLRGTGQGWTLSLKQSKQFSTLNNRELVGAMISYSNGELVSNVSETYAPEIKDQFVISTLNEEIDVVNAKQNEGLGTWLYRWGSDELTAGTSIQLTIPGETVKLAKSYQTTLIWSLKDVPTN